MEEASTTTSRIELPVSTLGEESLIRLQLFPHQTQEFSIHTPVVGSVDSAQHTENMLLAQQEFLREEADAERMRSNKQELILDQERNDIGADQERLRIVAGRIQKQSDINAMHIAMAQQRIKTKSIRRIRSIVLPGTRFVVQSLTYKRKLKMPGGLSRQKKLLKGSLLLTDKDSVNSILKKLMHKSSEKSLSHGACSKG